MMNGSMKTRLDQKWNCYKTSQLQSNRSLFTSWHQIRPFLRGFLWLLRYTCLMQTSIALGSWNFQVSLRLLRCASCGLLRVLPRSRLDPGVMSDPREACFEEKLEDTYFLRTVLGILICHIWEICIPTHEKSIFIWICFKPLLKFVAAFIL